MAAMFVGLPLAAADQKTCATCHAAQARSQPHTAMGIGIQLPGNQEVLKKHPRLTLQANGYTYVVESKDGVNTYTVSDGTRSLALPIRYAFGIGGSGQTFVFEYEGRFYESMVSYYTSLDGLAVTVGSERLRPHNLVEAMGRATSDDEILRCFGCHSSGGVSEDKLTLPSMRPGLDCEHCHTGSNAHMEAISQGKPVAAPKKLGALSAEDTSEFCGACHRTLNDVLEMATSGVETVRFQPYRLESSRCWGDGDARLTCIACHDPHQQLVRDAGAYDAKCLACHVVELTKKTSNDHPGERCPVATKNCITCHMPRVDVPNMHAPFTDHRIRIVRRGAPNPRRQE